MSTVGSGTCSPERTFLNFPLRCGSLPSVMRTVHKQREMGGGLALWQLLPPKSRTLSVWPSRYAGSLQLLFYIK